MGDAEQRLHHCEHSAATDTGTLSCSQPPTNHVFYICQTLLDQYFQLLEQRNLTNMSLTKDFSVFDCIYNECTVRAAWRCSGLHSLYCTLCRLPPTAQRHAWSGYQSQLWMLNLSLSALRQPGDLSTLYSASHPTTAGMDSGPPWPWAGYTQENGYMECRRYESLVFWMKWWKTEGFFFLIF